MSSKSLVILLCVSCGPPQIAGSASDDESGDGSTSSVSADSTDASSSTDSNSSTDSTDDTSTDGGFVPTNDIISHPNCDPFAQDCPEGEKCVPFASNGGSWDATKCVPVQGEQTAGEPCTYTGASESTDDCDATSFCWNVQEINGEMLGTCHSFCTGYADMPECPEGFFCPIASDGNINLCFPICDPIAQDCEDGLGCYWTSGEFACILTQEPGIADGQPCGFINDCLPGSVCIDGAYIPDCNGAACCSPFCDLQLGEPQCESVPGTMCSAFFEQGLAPPGYDHVGICVFEP